jgi:hypothetical protein
MDSITGGFTYENRLVSDHVGNLIDPKFGSLDYPDEWQSDTAHRGY